MKTLFAFAFALLVMTGTASAAMVDCGGVPPALTVDTYPPSGASGVTYSCNGLVFSDFEAVDAGTALPVVMNLVSAQFDDMTGWVYLNFNPNIAAFNEVEDVWFYYTVTGGISGIDLTVGGNGATINERACADGVNRLGNVCNGGLANQLAVLTNFSGNENVSVTFPNGTVDNSVSIFKDINVRNGELTSFTESHHAAAIPEPATTALMGAGLLVIGLAFRRQRKA